MTKNETELIIRRAKASNNATNNYAGAPPGAKSPRYRPCILAPPLAALFSAGACAQTQLATVSGTITDPSGAAVLGVSVTLVSQCTGLKRVRHNFVANAVYDLPGSGCLLGGWQVSAVANVHSGLPFTQVLDFDNAESIVTERPDVVGNPYAGFCANGTSAGTPSCWFNPSAFAVPPPGQFGNAGRNILRGPGFAQFDPALHKDFAIAEQRKITLGVEAYNLFNHPNFGVPGNTQNPLSLGGNGDAVFKDAAVDFAANAGQILTTAGTSRQIQLAGRFRF
jgi:hypothetical protein